MKNAVFDSERKKFMIKSPDGTTRELTMEEKKRMISLIVKIMVLLYIRAFNIAGEKEKRELKEKIGKEVSQGGEEKGGKFIGVINKLASKIKEDVDME